MKKIVVGDSGPHFNALEARVFKSVKESSPTSDTDTVNSCVPEEDSKSLLELMNMSK